jgi:hypothetical protein
MIIWKPTRVSNFEKKFKNQISFLLILKKISTNESFKNMGIAQH